MELFDITLQKLINQAWIHPSLDWLMPRISDLSLWTLPIALFALILLIWGNKREKLLIALIIVSICIGDMVIVRAIRSVIQRPRPYETLENVRYVTKEGVELKGGSSNTPSRGRSMPSAHVCNNTSAAFWLSFLYPPWGFLSWIIVALMAYSRVYTGSHYPADVIASIPIALAYNFLILWILKKYSPSFIKNLFPFKK